MRIAATVAACMLALSEPAAAQQRTLDVPASKGWQHAATGVTLTATIRGLPRTRLIDLTTDERDVVAQFNDPAVATSLTVYIFHPALPNAAIWFDRSSAMLALRSVYGGVTPAGPPQPFAHPGATVASGLRQVFATGKGPLRSTALAVAPLGEWLVTVRLSSTTLDPAALGGELDAVLAAIRWPAASGAAAPVAVPIAPCPATLPVAKAKLLKPTMQDNVLGGLFSGIALDHPGTAGDASAPAALCRDGAPTLDGGMYRRPDQTDGYLVALADAGRIATVASAVSIPGVAARRGYAVTLRDVDGSIATFPAFDRLPQPEQVVALVLKGRPLTRTVRGADGKTNVFVNAPPR